uniref:Uncharacterized protein n=1 Tax=Setaria italica TaxID=4555 RepID=K4AP99_SETIT
MGVEEAVGHSGFVCLPSSPSSTSGFFCRLVCWSLLR